jgi:hypothetical protein
MILSGYKLTLYRDYKLTLYCRTARTVMREI